MRKKLIIGTLIGTILGISTTVLAASGNWNVGNTSISGTLSVRDKRSVATAVTTDSVAGNKVDVQVALWAYNTSNVVDTSSRKYGTVHATKSSRDSFSAQNVKVWESMHSSVGGGKAYLQQS